MLIPYAGRYITVDNKKSLDILGLKYVGFKSTLIDTAYDMI